MLQYIILEVEGCAALSLSPYSPSPFFHRLNNSS